MKTAWLEYERNIDTEVVGEGREVLFKLSEPRRFRNKTGPLPKYESCYPEEARHIVILYIRPRGWQSWYSVAFPANDDGKPLTYIRIGKQNWYNTTPIMLMRELGYRVVLNEEQRTFCYSSIALPAER